MYLAQILKVQGARFGEFKFVEMCSELRELGDRVGRPSMLLHIGTEIVQSRQP